MSAQLASAYALREATAPPERRGVARDAVPMLVTDRANDRHELRRFFDLPEYLRAGDVLVVNDSTTLAAALRATRADGTALAVHVATMIDEQLWIVEPRAPVVAGEPVELADGARAVMLAPLDAQRPRLWYAQFTLPLPMHAFLAKHGEPIRYGYMQQRFPLADYQTLFARTPGSAEMPSAARPFTPPVVRAVRRAGASIATLTLHCGVSSFEAPERPSIERFAVPWQTARAVNAARERGNRVIAVGTTVVRALESAVRDGEVGAAAGWTDLVITPEHRLRAADALLTGLHEPTATHIALLRAFLPQAQLGAAYERAADRGMYVHEFGDVHLIL